jgi:hypothetical protein
VAIGTMTGLGSARIVFFVLWGTGIVGSGRNLIILVVLEFAALVLAGYIAGRFAPAGGAAHGGVAGLALFLVAGVISIAASPNSNVLELLVLALVAAVLGSAGGAYADWRRQS